VTGNSLCQKSQAVPGLRIDVASKLLESLGHAPKRKDERVVVQVLALILLAALCGHGMVAWSFVDVSGLESPFRLFRVCVYVVAPWAVADWFYVRGLPYRWWLWGAAMFLWGLGSVAYFVDKAVGGHLFKVAVGCLVLAAWCGLVFLQERAVRQREN